MGRISEMFEAVFAAVAFAEQGEWDEAVRIADGSLRRQAGIEEQPQVGEAPRKRGTDRRPRQRL